MEARLEDVGSGLAPVSPGWFVVNVAEAAWLRNDAFGGRCVFESNGRVLAERPDTEPQQFDQTGFTLAVLEPGQADGHVPRRVGPGGLPRARRDSACWSSRSRSAPLRAWDFVHCPPGTSHTFVGTGDEPCVIFMTGARTRTARSSTRVSETALARGAGVETETPSPREAYAPFSHWRLGRPDAWPEPALGLGRVARSRARVPRRQPARFVGFAGVTSSMQDALFFPRSPCLRSSCPGSSQGSRRQETDGGQRCLRHSSHVANPAGGSSMGSLPSSSPGVGMSMLAAHSASSSSDMGQVVCGASAWR